MKLYEYEAKKIFSKEGIPVPKSILITTCGGGEKFFGQSGKAILKAQVLSGGRGKSGVIKKANTLSDYKKICGEIFNKTLHGLKIDKLLVEEIVDIKKELYAGVIVDRAKGNIVIIFSDEGGMEIEAIPVEKIMRTDVNILDGVNESIVKNALGKFKFDDRISAQIVSIIIKLYNIFIKYDAEIAEINPLVITSDDEVIACDARVSIYEDALPRQKENLGEIFNREDPTLTPLEREAKTHNLGYIEMPGNIGVIGNGAGLNIATLDMLEFVGLKPANFLEVSGRTYDKAEKGLEIILKNPNVKALFGNFFGCISRCDVIADGIAQALGKNIVPENIPVVIAMRGNGGAEGRKVLQQFKRVAVFEDDEPAIKYLSEIVKKTA